MAHPLHRRLQRLEQRDQPPPERAVFAVLLPRFAANWPGDTWERFRSLCVSAGLDCPATPEEARASRDAQGRLRLPSALPVDAWQLMIASIAGPLPGSVDALDISGTLN